MKTLALSTVIFGTMASAAFAAEPTAPAAASKRPVMLTTAQLDGVKAGGLIGIKTGDIASDNNVQVGCSVVAACFKNENDN